MALVKSTDKLYHHIPKEQLTKTFGGTFQYNHEEWIRFRMRLEPFMCGCKSAAKFLLSSVDELSRGPGRASSEDLRQTIERLRVKRQEVYEDTRMASLRKEGDFILETLKKEEGALRQTEDFRLVHPLLPSLMQSHCQSQWKLTLTLTELLKRSKELLQTFHSKLGTTQHINCFSAKYRPSVQFKQ
ncbi:uncharacterized protein KIAA1755 homolog [Diadema antillarum]|uniref:uncharacterized protein KIAA1755 homolog n=1 Tax=Diadema antillarum TaxID=105358 RepID=UPI003A8400C1